MVTKSELESYIKSQTWPEQSKAKVLGLVGSLGKYGGQFVWDMMHEFGAGLIVDHMADGFIALYKAKDLFLHGNEGAFLKLIEKAGEDQSTDFGDYILPVALEIVESKNDSGSLNEQVMDFIYSRFIDIYPEALEGLLNQGWLSFLDHDDLVLQFSRWYDRKWLGTFAKNRLDFIKSLESNSEQLSANNIIGSENKSLAPTIENWLQAYSVFTNKPAEERETLEQIKFLQSFSGIKNLNPQEKNKLSNLIKIYNWLYNPVVNDKELDNYEANLQNNPNSYIQSQTFQIPPEVVQPQVPQPSKSIMSDVSMVAKKPSSVNFQPGLSFGLGNVSDAKKATEENKSGNQPPKQSPSQPPANSTTVVAKNVNLYSANDATSIDKKLEELKKRIK